MKSINHCLLRYIKHIYISTCWLSTTNHCNILRIQPCSTSRNDQVSARHKQLGSQTGYNQLLSGVLGDAMLLHLPKFFFSVEAFELIYMSQTNTWVEKATKQKARKVASVGTNSKQTQHIKGGLPSVRVALSENCGHLLWPFLNAI